MPNDTSQAAAVEPVTPQVAPVSEQTLITSAQTEPQTEEPINLETIRKLAREEATKIAQSQVAKGENRINARIEEQLKALNLNKDALGLSEEQVAQAKQKIVVDAYSAAVETSTNAPAQSPDVDRAIQFMNAEIENVFAEVGTSVTKADPEFAELQKAVNDSWNDARGLVKIMRAAEKAANAKAERVARHKETATARVVSGGQIQTSDPNDISGINDPKELYALGEKRLGGQRT